MTCMSEVMKNIYTFANILSAANTELVKYWDPLSVTKALKWANCCLQIEEATRNSIFRDDLDRKIQLMTILLKPVSLLHLSIEKLCDSPLLLYKNLAQNPHTPTDVLSRCEDTVGRQAEQDISPVQKKKMKSRVFQLIGEDVSFAERNDKSQAQYIMNRLVSLQKLCTSSQHRYDRFLEKIVFELQKYRNGWNVLIYMLLVDGVFESDYDIVCEIKKKVLGVVTFKAEDFICDLWRCPCSMLAEATDCDDGFGEMYTKHLMLWAEAMTPVYGIQNSGELYCWRHEDNHMYTGYSYTELKQHIIAIFSKSGRLRQKIETELTERSKLSYVNIYKDLLRDSQPISHRELSVDAFS